MRGPLGVIVTSHKLMEALQRWRWNKNGMPDAGQIFVSLTCFFKLHGNSDMLFLTYCPSGRWYAKVSSEGLHF